MRDAKHAPSPTRLKRARERGDIPQSTQLAAALQLAVAIGAALWLVPLMAGGLVEWTRQWWLNSATENVGTLAATENVIAGIAGLVLPCGLAIAGMLALSWLAIWLTGIVQAGWKPARRPMENSQLFHPMETLKSTVSANRCWNVACQAIGFTVVVTVLCLMFYGRLETLWQIDTSNPAAFTLGLFRFVCSFGGCIVALLVVGGVIDWYIQRRFWYRRQMMTDQEMREDARQDQSPRHRNGKILAGGSALDGVQKINTGS